MIVLVLNFRRSYHDDNFILGYFGVLLKQLFYLQNIFLQVKDAVDKRNTEIKKLEKRINEIVDRIYRDFSKSVGVANIREYEENQLKDAQNMADERLSLSSQLAKLKYQYASFFFYPHQYLYYICGMCR